MPGSYCSGFLLAAGVEAPLSGRAPGGRGRRTMKHLKKAVAKYAADLALIAGAAAVAVGAGMIYIPAGLIAGGVLAIAGVVLSSLGGGDSE